MTPGMWLQPSAPLGLWLESADVWHQAKHVPKSIHWLLSTPASHAASSEPFFHATSEVLLQDAISGACPSGHYVSWQVTHPLHHFTSPRITPLFELDGLESSSLLSLDKIHSPLASPALQLASCPAPQSHSSLPSCIPEAYALFPSQKDCHAAWLSCDAAHPLSPSLTCVLAESGSLLL